MADHKDLTGRGNEGNVLGFETAMAHFSAMFPQMSARLIESVLRKHDGNVAQTIEELLERSEAAETAMSSNNGIQFPSASSSSNAGHGEYEQKMQKSNGQKNSENVVSFASSSHPNTGAPPPQHRDPCAEDEKIALLIQNREFLRYLRQDPHFQRAIIGGQRQQRAVGHRWPPLPPGPALPQLLASTRPTQSPNTNRLFQRHSGKNLGEPPNGPMLADEAEEGATDRELMAIPEGPLIDYEPTDAGHSGGWAGRLKDKLGKRPPKGTEPLPASPLVHLSDEQMRQGVQGLLARGGRGLLQGLARKFSGGGGHPRRERLEEERPTTTAEGFGQQRHSWQQ